MKKKSAGGAPLKREAEFGCRTLVVFKGAGFDFSFSRISLLYLPEFGNKIRERPVCPRIPETTPISAYQNEPGAAGLGNRLLAFVFQPILQVLGARFGAGLEVAGATLLHVVGPNDGLGFYINQ